MTALVRKVSLKADPTITCVLLLVCATALVLRAQQSTGDVPTFRTSVEAVAFEVFVTDAAGKPVTDLTVDEFELLEDGKAQPITTFASTVIPIDPPRGKVNTWAVPADVATNTGAPGRTYIFALDESVIREDVLRTRLFLRQFLERYFGPNDLGAVLLVGRGLGTDGQTFTSSAALLLKAIDKWTGGWPIKDPAPPQFPYAPVGVDLRINTGEEVRGVTGNIEDGFVVRTDRAEYRAARVRGRPTQRRRFLARAVRRGRRRSDRIEAVADSAAWRGASHSGRWESKSSDPWRRLD